MVRTWCSVWAWAATLNALVCTRSAATSPGAGAVPQCAVDADCSLNGVCNTATGTCDCDAAWLGDSCSRLALQPTPLNAGYQGKDGRGAISSWGGTVMEGDPGTWHMVVAEAVNNCGLNSYSTNLQLVHAVSTNSFLGPYVKQSVVAAPVANTAHLARDPADGALLLFVTGCGAAAVRGCVPLTNCTNGTTNTHHRNVPPSCFNTTRCEDDDGTNVLRSASGFRNNGSLWELAVSPLLDTSR